VKAEKKLLAEQEGILIQLQENAEKNVATTLVKSAAHLEIAMTVVEIVEMIAAVLETVTTVEDTTETIVRSAAMTVISVETDVMIAEDITEMIEVDLVDAITAEEMTVKEADVGTGHHVMIAAVSETVMTVVSVETVAMIAVGITETTEAVLAVVMTAEEMTDRVVDVGMGRHEMTEEVSIAAMIVATEGIAVMIAEAGMTVATTVVHTIAEMIAEAAEVLVEVVAIETPHAAKDHRVVHVSGATCAIAVTLLVKMHRKRKSVGLSHRLHQI
jgi:hypothetical protein